MILFFLEVKHTREEDSEWFSRRSRLLFKAAQGEVGKGFRHHETMTEGAPLGRITVGYNAATYQPADRNKAQVSRRNYPKFASDRDQERPRRWSQSQPARSRGRRRKPAPAGPHRRRRNLQYRLDRRNIIWPGRSDLMQHSRGSGRKIIFDDLAASDSGRGQPSREGRKRRSKRSEQEDHNALLDSAKIRLENIIETFSEKLSNMTLDS